MPETKFEQDLKQYFPEIYDMHLVSKDQKFFWHMMTAITSMVKEQRYGQVIVKFQQGNIDRVLREEDVLHGKKGMPNLNRPK